MAVALNSFRPAVSWRHAASTVTVYKRLFAVAFGWRRALSYYHAAQLDEKEGFPFTAAMEWRMAAELFSFVPIARQRCWGEWERITHLPRRFANPIVEDDAIVRQDAAAATGNTVSTAVAKDALWVDRRGLRKRKRATTNLAISWRNSSTPGKTESKFASVAIKNESGLHLVSRSYRGEEIELVDGVVLLTRQAAAR